MIGFTRPKDGQRFLLIGSHFSTVPVGGTPYAKPGCAGCAAQVGTHPKGGDAKQAPGESLSDAVAEGHAPTIPTITKD